jgi:hypothetical protein
MIKNKLYLQNNKGFSNILIISIALILLGVGGYFGYMYTKKSQAPIVNELTTSQPESKKTQDEVNKPSEIEFTGIDNCPKNECKKIEVRFENKQIQFLDKDFNKLYILRRDGYTYQPNNQFDKNYIYFSETKRDANKNYEFIEIKIYSLNIKNGEIKELLKSSKDIPWLISGNKIFYVTGNSCAEFCLDPKETYFKTIFSYDIETKKFTKLNSKNLTDSGYVIKSGFTKFDVENRTFRIHKLEDNKLVMSFNSGVQVASSFFYFDLESKKVSNIDGNKIFGGEEINEKLADLGLYIPVINKLFIIDGELSIE